MAKTKKAPPFGKKPGANPFGKAAKPAVPFGKKPKPKPGGKKK